MGAEVPLQRPQHCRLYAPDVDPAVPQEADPSIGCWKVSNAEPPSPVPASSTSWESAEPAGRRVVIGSPRPNGMTTREWTDSQLEEVACG
jgi:hypothetical protein